MSEMDMMIKKLSPAEFERLTAAADILVNNSFHCYPDDDELYEDCVFDDLGLDYGVGASKVAILLGKFALKTYISGSMEWNDDTEEYEIHDEDYENYKETNKEYCEAEAIIYELAVERGLGDFFACTQSFQHDVYIQEGIEAKLLETYRYYKDATELEEEAKEIKRNLSYNSTLGLQLIIGFLSCEHTAEEIYALADFLDELEINDLHYGNCGWSSWDGKVKIFDFSGYGSNSYSISLEKYERMVANAD